MRVAIESRKPWVGFNIDANSFNNLIPQSYQKHEPHPYAEFRVAISTPEDILQLSPIILATTEKLIRDRARVQSEVLEKAE